MALLTDSGTRLAPVVGVQARSLINSRGAALGLAGGLAGLAAMDWFMKRSSGLVASEEREGKNISPLGPRHREEESSTAALGRIAYTHLRGEEPSESMQSKLSYGTHWSYGLMMASLYGSARAQRPRRQLDVGGGLAFGALLWLLGDETAVPLLGLKDSFSSYPPSQHLQALAGHLLYGAAVAVTSQLLLNQADASRSDANS